MPVVLDQDHDLLAFVLGGDLHDAAARRILDGVGKEIIEHLGQELWVAGHRQGAHAELFDDLLAGAISRWSWQTSCRMIAEIDFFWMEIEIGAAFDETGRGQQVLDQVGHAQHGGADFAGAARRPPRWRCVCRASSAGRRGRR